MKKTKCGRCQMERMCFYRIGAMFLVGKNRKEFLSLPICGEKCASQLFISRFFSGLGGRDLGIRILKNW